MNAVADAAFNYASLPVDKAAFARAAAERIRGRMQLAAESIIGVGRELIEQKKALGHGNFLPWIDAEFGMSERVAQNYMRVCNEFGANPKPVSDLNFKALLALSYAPPEVRAEVEERASRGEKVTAAEIEDLKRQIVAAREEAEIAEEEVVAQARRAELAEAANERLSDTVTDLQDEISRLSEDGVIHVAPAQKSSTTHADLDDDGDGDDDVSPRAVFHRAKIAFLVRAGEAEKYAFFPPDQKPDRDVLRQAELTMNAWKSLITKLKNGE